MGERVGSQLNGAYVFLGMHLLQTHKCFIISAMIKKSPIEYEYIWCQIIWKACWLAFEQNFYLISIRNKFLKAFVGVEEPQTELMLY